MRRYGQGYLWIRPDFRVETTETACPRCRVEPPFSNMPCGLCLSTGRVPLQLAFDYVLYPLQKLEGWQYRALKAKHWPDAINYPSAETLWIYELRERNGLFRRDWLGRSRQPSPVEYRILFELPRCRECQGLGVGITDKPGETG